MLIDRNNLHDVDTWMFFKWTFKTFVAVMILANTFNIALAVFDVSQPVIQQSAGHYPERDRDHAGRDGQPADGA